MGGIIIDGKKLPQVKRFEEVDRVLIKDLEAVFNKHLNLEGSIRRIEFDCGMPKLPKPPRCFRICVSGPDDRPICTWICW